MYKGVQKVSLGDRRVPNNVNTFYLKTTGELLFLFVWKNGYSYCQETSRIMFRVCKVTQGHSKLHR